MKTTNSGGCGNCQFMLDCLRQAPFMDERRQIKNPNSLLSRKQHYQVMLHYSGIQSECVLKLESAYTRVHHSPKRDEEVWSLGNLSRPKIYGQNPVDQSYIMATCPLVFSHDKSSTSSLWWPLNSGNLLVENGKCIDKDPRSLASISHVSRWMKECETHASCPPQTCVLLPTRVIKISNVAEANPSLWITRGALGKYIALSHCWGKSVAVTTTLSNIEAHENGIVLTSLPRSFRDAIDLARMLGFTYIWIDSICIIQDSVEDWASECSKMADVYADATLVVSAAAAEDSTRGFLNTRNFLQGPQLDTRSKTFLREKVTSRKAQATSPLSFRAWAYQEALLAPRLLMYTNSQMAWECRHGIKDEGVNAVVSSNNSCLKKHFYRTIDLPLSMPYIPSWVKGISDSLFIPKVCGRLNTWYGCVEDYSHRQLTQASDKLPALSGLASVIHDPALGEYLAGIWSKDLGTGLFWTRHIAREELYGRPFSKCQKYRAPSWSWASHEGPANFRIEPDTCSQQAIATDTVFRQSPLEVDISPKLLDHKMLLASSDRFGRVLQGSYILLEGFSRLVYQLNPEYEAAPKSMFAQGVATPNQTLVNHTFTMRRDHPHGLQEKYAWSSSISTESRTLLRFSSSRCLILRYIGDDSWERDGWCILPPNASNSWEEQSYVGWEKKIFKMV